jgi:hypothetical protein
MSLIKNLLERQSTLSTASAYSAISGVLYLTIGVLFVVWPGMTQTLFMDRDFVGDERGLVRILGFTVVVIGWLYLFGARTGGRQFIAATVIDRLIFVPVVLLPLAFAGVFPHVLVAFTVLDMSLAVGAWLLLSRRHDALSYRRCWRRLTQSRQSADRIICYLC